MCLEGHLRRALVCFAAMLAASAALRAQPSVDDEPLTAGDKWEFGTAEVFEPLTILSIGAAVGFRQQQNQFPTLGQGLMGFTKRYGIAFANHAGSDYMTGSIFPVLLKEDPRYFRKGDGNLFHRLYYAGSRIGVTRTDKGHSRFNFSEFLGNAAGALMSNLYLPHGDRTVSYSSQTFGLFLASDALTNVLSEFWPDVRHKLFHGPVPKKGAIPAHSTHDPKTAIAAQ